MNKAILVLSLILVTFIASAQQLAVPGEYSNIQAAIEAATDGDTVLVAEGTYYENINFLGKAITVGSAYVIDGDTAHISKTIIDGSQATNADTASTVMMFSGEDTTSVLCGLTITGGKGSIINSFYRSSLTHRGGGGVLISMNGGKIIHNIIEENHMITADVRGNVGCGIAAAVNHNHSAVIRNNVIRNNSGSGNGGWGGGAAITGGRIHFENNLVLDNELIIPSGICAGGGIFYESDNFEGTTKEVIIRNNTIQGNILTGSPSNTFGAGIVLGLAPNPFTLEMYNNVIADNYSKGFGGGVYCWGPTGVVHSNTILDNEAEAGGNSIYVDQSGKLFLYNNIIWSDKNNNYPDMDSWDASGRIYAYYNILKEPIEIPGYEDFSYNTYIKPTFKNGTYELDENSPAIGRGLTSVDILGSSYEAPLTDYLGNQRVNAVDTNIDLGAFESEYALHLIDNANLVFLGLDTFKLVPDFDEAVYEYSMRIPDTLSTWDGVGAIPYDNLAEVNIEHASDIDGSEEERTTQITVTSSDNSTSNTYSILFNALSYNCLLKSLSVDGYDFDKDFDPDVDFYHVYLDEGDEDIPEVLYEIDDPKSTVDYKPATDLFGPIKDQITKIQVTAECAHFVKTYSVRFHLYTGIENSRKKEKLKLYPNPFSDITNLELPQGISVSKIEILNMTGSVLRSLENVQSGTITLSREGLASGLYIIKVFADEVYVNKVMIK